MIVAIDGPAASGKGTLGRRLAAHYGLVYLDTGSLYRAVARDVLASGRDPGDADAAAHVARRLDPGSLDDPGLRGPHIGAAASVVAAHPPVRKALLSFQRSIAQAPEGALLEGRDIGTVVCPGADVKLFVTAAAPERARRRHAELVELGNDVSYRWVLDDILKRDARDSKRAASPLRPASDAHLLDTTDLGIEAAFKAAVELIDAAIDQAGRAS